MAIVMRFFGLFRYLFRGKEHIENTQVPAGDALEPQTGGNSMDAAEPRSGNMQAVDLVRSMSSTLANLQLEVNTLKSQLISQSSRSSTSGNPHDTAALADQSHANGLQQVNSAPGCASSMVSGRAAGNQLIRLDVGGQHFTTSRQTLETYSESKLAAMVSGRFGQSAFGDDGRMFIDRDGALFPYVLDFLRNGPNWHPPQDSILVERLLDEFDYLNLPWIDALEQWTAAADDNPPVQQLYALGGWGMNSMERYSFQRGRWELCGVLPQTGYENVAACILSGKFLVAGGGLQDNGSASCIVNPANSTSTIIKPLTHGRSMHAAVTCRGVAYVLGGSTPEMLHMPGEQYVPERDSWVQFKGPEASLRRCSAAELDGVIYAAAGCLQQRDGEAYCGKVVQMYDPRIGSWQTRGSLRFARERHAVAAAGDRLWCIGGLPPRGEDTYRASVECYEPRTCTSLVIPDMSVARAGCSAVVAGPHIFVVGGYGRDRLDSPSLNLVERLDWGRCQWSVAAPMLLGRTKHTVLAL